MDDTNEGSKHMHTFFIVYQQIHVRLVITCTHSLPTITRHQYVLFVMHTNYCHYVQLLVFGISNQTYNNLPWHYISSSYIIFSCKYTFRKMKEALSLFTEAIHLLLHTTETGTVCMVLILSSDTDACPVCLGSDHSSKGGESGYTMRTWRIQNLLHPHQDIQLIMPIPLNVVENVCAPLPYSMPCELLSGWLKCVPPFFCNG